ncbi:hypothetical protein J2X68_007600 [Streptomyces sp. 3330]|nr:hypothetical protein [Streptomyces sp. 3330]
MLIVALEGDRGCTLRPHQRALCVLVCQRRHDPLTQIAAGFGISVGTAHANVTAAAGRLARRVPGLPRLLRETDLEHVLPDGTPAACDGVGDIRADFSHQHRRHGVTVQVTAESRRQPAVHLARPAQPHPRPDHSPRPPHHPDL